ncbi:hypothetical protein RIN58_07315 [Siccibacter colletis]|uniref:hypothetical protein n=1 Tax=Siccibacter colletis TaxID=1505757 RepID=UPI0028BD9E3D|nr:hypothetical protein [Siccibacter colletis]WNN49900.1 hypothetical protein RIN58_07315 [Siccibacter colletis]
MDEHIKKVEEDLRAYDEIIHQNFHKGLIDSASLATIESTTTLDKFSIWMLVGVGATATLIISNIDKILPYLGAIGFNLAVFFLTLSALAGFIAKYYAIVVSISAAVTVRMDELAKEKQAAYEKSIELRDGLAKEIGYESIHQININDFYEAYISLFPFKRLRLKIRMAIAAHSSQPHSGNKPAVHGVVYQSIALLFQALFYIAFLLVVVLFISMS